MAQAAPDRERPEEDAERERRPPRGEVGRLRGVREEGRDEGDEGEGDDCREERDGEGEEDEGRVGEDGLAGELRVGAV